MKVTDATEENETVEDEGSVKLKYITPQQIITTHVDGCLVSGPNPTGNLTLNCYLDSAIPEFQTLDKVSPDTYRGQDTKITQCREIVAKINLTPKTALDLVEILIKRAELSKNVMAELGKEL